MIERSDKTETFVWPGFHIIAVMSLENAVRVGDHMDTSLEAHQNEEVTKSKGLPESCEIYYHRTHPS